MAYTISDRILHKFKSDQYEGSYKDIFSSIDFNFLVSSVQRKKNEIGRPNYPPSALFGALILKSLVVNASYRTVEAILKQDGELASLVGFTFNNIPSDSTLRQYFSSLSLEDIYKANKLLLDELRSQGYAKGYKVALDSTPINAYCKAPTKRNPEKKDLDARWGKAKCKGGWYLGYKVQVIVDAEDNLPLYSITTPANISDQVMVRPFVKQLKELDYKPELALLDAGYDSENNHLILREGLGCISLISPNKRRNKKKYSEKSVNYNKKLLYQTTLEKYIPIDSRKKRYRKCCLVMQDSEMYKKQYRKRVASEIQFAILKKDLFLEDHKLIGLKNIQKYIALKCLCMLIIAVTALHLNMPEVMRSPKYFQH